MYQIGRFEVTMGVTLFVEGRDNLEVWNFQEFTKPCWFNWRIVVRTNNNHHKYKQIYSRNQYTAPNRTNNSSKP